MTAAKPPVGLADRGRRYWRSVTGTYELSDSERALLLEACRTLDNLDALADAVTRDGATTLGSMGQTVVHPALTEARGQRIVLHRLIAALALPDPDSGQTIPTTATTKARTAATARWRGHAKGA